MTRHLAGAAGERASLSRVTGSRLGIEASRRIPLPALGRTDVSASGSWNQPRIPSADEPSSHTIGCDGGGSSGRRRK